MKEFHHTRMVETLLLIFRFQLGLSPCKESEQSVPFASVQFLFLSFSELASPIINDAWSPQQGHVDLLFSSRFSEQEQWVLLPGLMSPKSCAWNGCLPRQPGANWKSELL